jgi:RNA polymerase sigma factor (sigma-70 family)
MSADHKPSAHDFASFYQATLAPLRRYLGRILGNRAEAQDVAHDAYSRVYRAMETDQVNQPQGLLYTTARHLAINQLRRRDRSPVQPAEAEIIALSPAQSPAVEDIVAARLQLADVKAAIARLPLGCRTVLLLCQFEGLTHPQVAARLGISRKTVEKQHARALRLLRASLPVDLPRANATPTDAEQPRRDAHG